MKKIIYGILILFLASCGNEKATNGQQNSNPNNNKFVWDFSTQKKFIYSFTQIVNGENKMDKDRPVEKTYMIGNGNQLSLRLYFSIRS